MDEAQRWNHNIHYHPLVLTALPRHARRAVDLGCGEGTLARELRGLVPEVHGVDRDAASIALAREQDPDGDITFHLADVADVDLEDASFDLIASVATLHHLDPTAALTRMRELVAPGGRLVVIAIPHLHPVWSAGWIAACVLADRRRVARGGRFWEHPSPMVWPPPHGYRELRRIARTLLPGVRCRRHLFARCSLTWTAPPG